MSRDKLRQLYIIVYKTLTLERAMREQVLRPGPGKQQRIEEVDRALGALEAMKDFCKLHTEEPTEQVMLDLDVPTKKGAY